MILLRLTLLKSLQLFLLAICLCACDTQYKVFSKKCTAIVSVGESKLCAEDIERTSPSWKLLSDNEKLAYLEHWIDEETIYQEALSNGALNDTMLQERIQKVNRKMVVDNFLQSFIDTMIVGDAEQLDFYNSHKDLFLRGKTMVSGAILFFKNWQAADLYYKGHKKLVYKSIPEPNYLVKRIEKFDSLTFTPDSCILPSITNVEIGKLQNLKVCNGALKMAVVVQKLDSSDVLPYAEVKSHVIAHAWALHQKIVIDSLKKEWKRSRPIFSKANVFNKKDE